MYLEFCFFVCICQVCIIVLSESVPIEKLDCSFEEDELCAYWNYTSPPWKATKYTSEQTFTGLQNNATAQDKEYYLFTGAKKNNESAVAILESNEIPGSDNTNGKTCFILWYYMYGIHIQNLTVTANGIENLIAEGDQGQMWKCEVLDVTSLTGKITITAYRTTELLSTIAIDNIQIRHSTSCNNVCEADVTKTTSSSEAMESPSIITTTTTTTQPPTTEEDSGGLQDHLPIVIGVPCGVLLVGGIIVGCCIYRRRNSKEFVENRKRRTNDNPYTQSPRQSADVLSGVYEEEIYNELDEKEMIGGDNEGYLDPLAYDDIGEVELRRDGTAGYINERMTRPYSEDYLEPASEKKNSEVTRHSSNDYLNAGQVPNGRPQRSDYLELNSLTADQFQNGKTEPYDRQEHNEIPQSITKPTHSSAEPEKAGRPISDDYLEPEEHFDEGDYIKARPSTTI